MYQFVEENYRHFNARALKQAAQGYVDHLKKGGKMFVTLAGAMSTAELGISLAPMIRKGYVSGICCTGANLEEDLFNATAHNHYHLIESYRDLSPEDEQQLLNRGMNRVTDTCIPETEAMREVEKHILPLWKAASKSGEARLPHEYFYEIALKEEFQNSFQIPRENSWLLAAAENNIPLFVPGWEDSTFGNFVVSHAVEGTINLSCIKSGLHYMVALIEWYKSVSSDPGIGFFQIGGGIAGDFPICVVPLLQQDLGENVPLWSYFCQITDAQESYGGYSGALPNEKITWGKLAPETPKFVVHSDASIVAPIIFAYVMEAMDA